MGNNDQQGPTPEEKVLKKKQKDEQIALEKKEQKELEILEKKNKTMMSSLFCRRIRKGGIYTGNCHGKTIRIKDRGVYKPLNVEEATFLFDDPEIELLEK